MRSPELLLPPDKTQDENRSPGMVSGPNARCGLISPSVEAPAQEFQEPEEETLTPGGDAPQDKRLSLSSNQCPEGSVLWTGETSGAPGADMSCLRRTLCQGCCGAATGPACDGDYPRSGPSVSYRVGHFGCAARCPRLKRCILQSIQRYAVSILP